MSDCNLRRHLRVLPFSLSSFVQMRFNLRKSFPLLTTKVSLWILLLRFGLNVLLLNRCLQRPEKPQAFVGLVRFHRCTVSRNGLALLVNGEIY